MLGETANGLPIQWSVSQRCVSVVISTMFGLPNVRHLSCAGLRYASAGTSVGWCTSEIELRSPSMSSMRASAAAL